MKKRLFIWVLITLSIVACNNDDRNVAEAIINDTPEMLIKEKTLMSSFIEVKRVIALETSNACLLGEMEKVMKRDGIIFVKSKGKPLTLFDESGRFLNTVGAIGAGPEEYSLQADFDISGNTIYILTVNRIQVYAKDGKWMKSIPISLNASGLRLTENKILLFVLGDKHVVHVLNKDGNEEKCMLERNQTFRLNRAISFVKYGEKILFPMGRSNELLVYDTSGKGEFSRINYLASSRLTNEKEAMLMEENPQHNREMLRSGCFDGLLTNGTQVIFPFIKEDGPVLWVKDRQNSQSWAYLFSSLENDITFAPAPNFFYDNVEDDCGFLTYIMPYLLRENMEKANKKVQSPYFEMMRTIVEQTDEEANPILIEYMIKDK